MEAKRKRGRPRTITAKQYKARQMANTAKWRKENTKTVSLILRNDRDADIILWLDEHKPKQAYLRGLIRKDMDESGN